MDRAAHPDRIPDGDFAGILVEATGYAVISIDPDGLIINWNAAAERLFGWPADEVRGQPGELIFTPEDRQAGVPALEMRSALADGAASDVRWHVRRDGSRFWAVGEMTALWRDGRHLGFGKILRDRTLERRTEDQLAASEGRLRLMGDSARLATWEYDTAAQTMASNPDLLNLLVWPTGQPFNVQALRRRYLPGERERMRAAAKDAFRGGKRFFEVEFAMRCGDEQVRWFNLRAEVRLSPEGTPAKILGVLLDVSDRHQAREALRLGEERLRIAQAAGGIGAFELGEATGDLTVSEEFCRIWGIAPRPTLAFSEMIGSVHPDDRDSVLKARAGLQPGAADYVEYRIRRADTGEERWIARRGEMVPAAAAGDWRFVGIITDITERKQAEDALRQSELRWRGLFERMQEGFFLGEVVGGPGVRDFRFLELNPAFENLTGLRATDALGRTVREVIPGFPEDLIDAYVHVAETGEPLHLETHVPALGNRWYEARARKVAAGRFAVLFMEITARKAAAEDLTKLNATLEARVAERTAELNEAHEALRQSQKMEAVGQLTGGIAHDFNNLLTGISGSLELMQRRLRQGRTNEIEAYIVAATASANRAAALTHRLLAFSRRQPLDPRPLEANRLVMSMEELLRRTLGERIDLKLALADDLWQPLCDPNQLENALLNLAINARDAMPEGGGLIIETSNTHLDSAYAARTRDVTAGPYVCISVGDTGFGMSREVIERAFDPFFTTKPLGQGTGLGLSMIYGFARQSEGHAKIYSEEGHGTVVKLYLPRHIAEGETPAAEEREPSPIVRRAGGGETVLVVEDESAVRDLVVEILTDLNYRVLSASDGPSGLELARSDAGIDLLVTDVGLPGLNGRQLADAARAARPRLKVLFMTGYAENAAMANGFLEPGMHMITKPFPIEALIGRIQSMLADGDEVRS